MYMMYVDESGDTGYPEDNNRAAWKGSTHFARVGVVIHGMNWKACHDQLSSFKMSHGLAGFDEIKASDIRRGKKAFMGWDESRRLQFFSQLMMLVGENEAITLLGVAIDKRPVAEALEPLRLSPEAKSPSSWRPCHLRYSLSSTTAFCTNRRTRRAWSF
jgi:hypothetical protein